MADKDDKPWFAPKRYGYGAGLSVAWEGWALLAGYGLALLAAILIAERSPLATLSIIVSATALLLLIAARKTRGGWRWRWGSRD
ncbi:MAG TPA: hypothetical protein VGE84_02415 [Allosphingosinicella sp.]